MSLDLHAIRVLAAKELRDRLRSRWVLVVALVFTLFSSVIVYAGSAQQGFLGFRGVEVTIASLVSLVIYLVPLIALILGYDSVVGERERGSLDLLLSMPISRLELLLGKFGGLALALAIATLAGLGVVGVALAWSAPTALLDYAGFVLSSLLLGMSFLSMAMLVSVLASDRTQASGAAIGLWFAWVLIYDLLLLAALLLAGDGGLGSILSYGLLFNPTDVYRILNVFHSQDMRTLYGLGSVLPGALSQTWVLSIVMVLWIVLPLFWAGWRFCRTDSYGRDEEDSA